METSPTPLIYIGVVGAGVPDPDTDRLAEAVGLAVGESRAVALKTGTPVVGIETWDLPGVAPFGDPVEAVEEALRLAGRTIK